MIDDARLARLPKWAFDELVLLRRTVKEKESEIALLKGDAPSRVWEGWGYEGKRRPLGDAANVFFQLTANATIETCLTQGGKLRVSANNGTLIIEPGASNVVYVSATKI